MLELPLRDQEFTQFALEHAAQEQSLYQRMLRGETPVNKARLREWIRNTVYYRPDLCRIEHHSRTGVTGTTEQTTRLYIAQVWIVTARCHCDLNRFCRTGLAAS